MKRLIGFMVMVCLMSCDYFDKKKVNTEQLLQEELKTFNWKDVDEYPSFDSCDSAVEKADKKACFESTLRAILNKNLANQTIIVSEDINDTVFLKITIDRHGVFAINSILSTKRLETEIPQLDSLLRSSLDSLPKIYPAIKRSQQVATQFTLPVLVQIQ
ncbi:hypothetical protein ESY86_19525 [Subsaximicrobium wynnwilliamsii]|uniref:TonB C-terminal domain-containing protein n=1 Tax=Subsaximicrobium wynnwilliamsii TaxID=291179 RepID=A0A5C6ZAN1_9FLAO|nr:hypothetical protein [Subsaximicrobium wynnwilliamsii]TXD81039.1 hypothetical protein ESY87_19500 [Subsaximicrobium wynnwilliamsii]TXD86731.1 hypothetical protein ESY86_19525 [Subsaximicrobium wynnwilliamsii]TXE00369.1 hypothetical protein ESY88_19555 [Subsaximicrobium wynnwilliamsii]